MKEDELKKLKRERNQLIAKREVKESMWKRQAEKNKLKAEIRREKYDGFFKAASVASKVASNIGKRAKASTNKKLAPVKRKAKRVVRKSPANLNEAIFGGY